MEENSNGAGNPGNSSAAIGINSDAAKRMFRDYHGVPYNTPATLSDSNGVLKTWNGTNQSPLQHFIVDYTSVIASLKTKAEQAGLHFMGLAGIPAINDQGDTFIFVAVVANDASGTNKRLLLPDNNSANDFIYDHVELCPDFCENIHNQANLWKDWLADS